MLRARGKLFTPLNVGAFELRHRLVVDWRGSSASSSPERLAHRLGREPWDRGGLVIHDPAALLWPASHSVPSLGPDGERRAWRSFIETAKGIRQSVVAKLRTNVRSHLRGLPDDISALTHLEIERITDHYARAAESAHTTGFDGVELDATAGSVSDLFRAPTTNVRSDRYGGGVSQRLVFLTELVVALTRVVGRDRVGVRLSPFRKTEWREARVEGFDDAVRALNELEVAYIHLVDGDPAKRSTAKTIDLSSTAEALRHAHAGILISSAGSSLVDAVELVESRWADAVCYVGSRFDLETCEELRRVWPDAA